MPTETSSPDRKDLLAGSLRRQDAGGLRLLLFLAPFLCVVAVVIRYGVDIPYFDEWMFTKTIHEALDGKPLWDALMFPHNEHRMPIPRAILLGFVFLTDWNILAELFFNLLLAFLSYLTLDHIVRKTLGAGSVPWWLPPSIGVLLFSLVGWEAWTWSWMMANHLCLLFALVSLALLSTGRLNSVRVALASLFAFLSFFSFGNGALLWPLGVLALGIRERSWAIWRSPRQWVWLGAGCLSLVLYFYDYSPELQGIGSGGHSWGQLLPYASMALGNVVTGPDAIAAKGWGLAGLITFAFLSLRLSFRPSELAQRALPWILVGLFGIGTIVLAWWGRGRVDVHQGMAPRYVLFACLPWISILALLALLVRDLEKEGRRPGVHHLLMAVALILTAVAVRSSIRSLPHVAYHAARLRACQEDLLRGRKLSPDQKIFLYTIPYWHEENRTLLAPRGWSLYRQRPRRDLFPALVGENRHPRLELHGQNASRFQIRLTPLQPGDVFIVGILQVDGVPTWIPLRMGKAGKATTEVIDVDLPPQASKPRLQLRAWYQRGTYSDLTPPLVVDLTGK